jgi:hypothetical protein
MRLNQNFRRAVPAAALCALGLASCDSLMDVKNPNNVKQEDLENPVAAAALVAGSTAEVADGVVTLLRAEVTISDETRWIGSQNAAQEHDQGAIGDPDNEFSGSAFNQMSEGRWLADEAIRLLKGFDEEGTLKSRQLLAQALLQGGIVYTYIPELFDDFVISNRREAAPPVGDANMVKLFDTAIGYLSEGLSIARATGNKSLELELLAMRARANFSKALWAKLNPSVNTAAPLVHSAAAAEDARAALALAPSIDWAYQYRFTPTTISNDIGSWLTRRFEVRLSDAVAEVDPKNAKKTTAIKLLDPIDQVPAPRATQIMKDFYAQEQYWPLTVVSARELHLILAESALAQGNVAEAATHLNAIRTADGLTPVSSTAEASVALQVLKHMRRTNLLLQGRRLLDQFRFNEPAQEWLSTSDAVARPGTFLPITRDEINANCHISGACK